jgi:hypothetical protein
MSKTIYFSKFIQKNKYIIEDSGLLGLPGD